MKSIKDIAKTPSEAVEAMITGLKRQNERREFRIDMSSFGYTNGIYCYGCAATCTIQEIAGRSFIPDNDSIEGRLQRSLYLDLDRYEVNQFEYAINDFRMGNIRTLFMFYDLEFPHVLNKYIQSWQLENENWEEQIPAIEKFVKVLKAYGY